MITVYYATPSIYGRKVLAVLEEKELDYTIQSLSFEQGDHQKPEYLEINPNGEIPTLKDDTFVVYESTAIIEYLNDEYPEPPLMPEDSEPRAVIRYIEDFMDLQLYPAIISCMKQKLIEKVDPSPECLADISKGLDRLEQYLGKKAFLSNEFSLADCAAMSAFASLEGLGLKDLVKSESLKNYWNVLKGRKGYKGASTFEVPSPAAQG